MEKPSGTYKTELGMEFCELARQSGLKDNKIAEALGLDKGSISRYLAGKKDPKLPTVLAMRAIVAKINREKRLQDSTASHYPRPPKEKILGMDGAEVEQATEMLREIHEAAPTDFNLLREVIGTYHSKRKRRDKETNSATLAKVEWAFSDSLHEVSAAPDDAKSSPDVPANPQPPANRRYSRNTPPPKKKV